MVSTRNPAGIVFGQVIQFLGGGTLLEESIICGRDVRLYSLAAHPVFHLCFLTFEPASWFLSHHHGLHPIWSYIPK